MKTREKVGQWFSAHLWKTDFRAVGRTESDVQEAYAAELQEGTVVNKRWGLPLMEKAGLSVHETSRGALKMNEVLAKVGMILPAVGGLLFLARSVEILNRAGAHGVELAIGGLMGLVGLAAVTLGQAIMWQTGEVYGGMYRWARDNGVERPMMGTQYWPGRHLAQM
jgi:hypothetical protein